VVHLNFATYADDIFSTFMSFGLLMAVKISNVVFCFLTPCSLVSGYQRFEVSYLVHLQGRSYFSKRSLLFCIFGCFWGFICRRHKLLKTLHCVESWIVLLRIVWLVLPEILHYMSRHYFTSCFF